MVSKGEIGLLIEKQILKKLYNSNYCPKNNKYDLHKENNYFNGKNVSIKASKTNTIYCGDVFNFISSVSLDFIIISYKLISNKLKIINTYLFSELDEFFIQLNNNINFSELEKLRCYLKTIKHPFSDGEKKKCYAVSNLIVKNKLYGFSINLKLSRSNKRIQCSLKLNQPLSGKLTLRKINFFFHN